MSPPNCSNCGAPLTGPYCAACGQHVHDSARTIGALFHDAIHVMTHVDGRFWQTMDLLLLRPGRLTQEYFAERRARYLPPVRVYLVLSLLFFALGPLGRHSLNEATTGSSIIGADAATALPAPHEQAHGSGASRGAQNRGNRFNLEFGDCDKLKTSFKWLEEPLQRSCRRNVAYGGAPVRDAFVANVPKMMFVFLPLLAAVMLLMYWHPRRYYVEHLVFFLHTHAAMFLILLILPPLFWVVGRFPALEAWDRFIKFGACLYAAWYVYRAMRVYYEQRRWLTLAKYIVVGIMYTVFLSITLLATLIVSALMA
jgi:hypothetical protein